MNDVTETELPPATPPEPEAFDRGQPYLPASWYLIQRLNRRDSPPREAKGVDRLLSHDYMGAAEFEYGAMGKTWKALRTLASIDGPGLCIVHEHEPLLTKVAGAPAVSYICARGANVSFIRTQLARLASDDRSFYLKEWTNFSSHFQRPSRETEHRRRTVAWIVLDDEAPFFWSVDPLLTTKVFHEVCRDPNMPPPIKTSRPSPKGVRAEDLYVFQEVRFDHAGRTHTGSVRGIHDRHATILCDDSDLKGRQRINYAEIWKP